jgi:hypothetical protein
VGSREWGVKKNATKAQRQEVARMGKISQLFIIYFQSGAVLTEINI